MSLRDTKLKSLLWGRFLFLEDGRHFEMKHAEEDKPGKEGVFESTQRKWLVDRGFREP